MRPISLAVLSILLLLSCQPKPDTQADALKVEQVLRDFFVAITEFNYQGIRDLCTIEILFLKAISRKS